MEDKEKQLRYLEPFDESKLLGYTKKCFEGMRYITQNGRMVKDIQDSLSPILERNYMLSLVYEMGKHEGTNEVEEPVLASSGLFVGGETNKFINTKDNENILNTANDLNITVENSRFEAIPDLIVHNSHNPSCGETGEGQHLALEAKTTKRLGKVVFMKDFFKLNVYLSALNYEVAIYLIVNTRTEKVDELIGNYIENGYYCCKKGKLFFFIQDDIMSEPMIYIFNKNKIQEAGCTT